MKRLFSLLFILLLIGGSLIAWIVLGPDTGFREKTKYFYIPTDSVNRGYILARLESDSIVKNTGNFDKLADRMNYWSSIKSGRYRIDKGESLLDIVRKLRAGRQSPVTLTILKLRLPTDIGMLAAKKLELDSASMMNYVNSMEYMQKAGVDSFNVLTEVIPDTYSFYWDASPETVMEKFGAAKEKFWTTERKQKAEKLGLTQKQVYILASIVEEETRDEEEKKLISSVYLNRFRKGMKLQADPTSKFASGEFDATHIYYKYTRLESPFNTYFVTGLPIGPICTPSKKTMDAVLETPETDYIYFVANPDFSGNHIFTSNFNEHRKYAQQFRISLRKWEAHRDSVNKGLIAKDQ